PDADLHPGPPQRPAVRRRHRRAGRQGHAGGAGPRQPVPGPARRQPPLVPLPPPVRGRPPNPPPGRAHPPPPPPPSQWYEQHTEPAQAVRHALAAGDVERAAALVELAIPVLRKTRQEGKLRSWVAAHTAA